MKIKHVLLAYVGMIFILFIFLLDVIRLNARVSQLENAQCDNSYYYKED